MKNFMMIEGRLTADPEIKTGTRPGKDGKQEPYTLLSFSVAYETEASSGEKEDGTKDHTNFINCQTWSKAMADYIGPHLKKGRAVLVTGEPLQNRYVDKEGNKKTNSRLAIQRITLAEFPAKQKGEGEAQAAATGSDGSPVQV